MVRRRGSYTPDKTIPPGWITHDGTCVPVPLDSKPAVMRRSGHKSSAGGKARNWTMFAEGCLWSWAEREPDDWDIIAYLPESEWVEVERMGL